MKAVSSDNLQSRQQNEHSFTKTCRHVFQTKSLPSPQFL